MAGTTGTALSAAAGTSTSTSATPGPVPGLTEVVPQGSIDLGAAPDRVRAVTLSLGLRDSAGLRSVLAGPHAPLTAAQFNDRYAPTQGSVDAVTGWARSAGLQVDAVSPNRQLVSLSGPTSVLGDALHTRFDSFRDTGGRTFTGAVGTAQLPPAISQLTSAVLGLNDLGQVSHPLHHAAPAAALTYGSAFGPQDFARIYHAPATATGGGQTAAVLAEGDLTQVREDLVTFEAKFGLPQVPFTTIGAGSADVAGADEYDLDTQYSTGFAPGVSSLLVYDGASLANADIAKTINNWVTDNRAPQASFSAGECELLASVSGLTAALDPILMQADAHGQSLFVSSGDNGSFCSALVGVNGIPAGVPNVEYPAASPYAIGVGGTSVITDTPTEIAWYAGGGGIAATEPAATFAAGVRGSYLGVNRGVPDVALDADPNSGYRVIVAGTEMTIGGTSASAPAWQGIWLRAQGAHGGALGFAGPVIYREPVLAFHDIVVGSNGLFPAAPGYDYVTGRGTADITAFVNGA